MLKLLFEWAEKATDPFPEAQPGMPPDRLLPFLLHYSWPFRKLIAASALLATVIAVLEVSLFQFVGRAIDWLAATDREHFWQDYGWAVAGLGVLAVLVIPSLKLIYEVIVHQGLLGNFAMRTRWEAHRYVLRQSMEYFQNDFAGRVATKVMQTALAVREVVMKLAEVMVFISVFFLTSLVMFAIADWRLAVPLVIWLIGYVAALRYFVPRLRHISMQQSDARSTVTGRIVDSYTNIATVKMFAAPEFEDAYARGGMEHFLDTVYGQMRLVTRLVNCLNILNAMLIFSIIGLSLWLWSLNAVTAGTIAFASSMALRMQGMAHWILWEVAGLFENIGIVQDGIEAISRERAVTDPPDAVELTVPRGEIRYDGIGFNYGKAFHRQQQQIIDNLSLTVRPGEKIGIVGRSGAGKSTIVSLLLRFYDLEQGRILIDGQDIAGVTQNSLRNHIGIVTQDTSLLHRSVLDNIRYGKPEATLEQVIAAARKAHAHDFIAGLSDLAGRRGYDAHVGERGVKLSGGQRQRIAIARVLLKDAPILVLDEATSALDSEVEAAIQENLIGLMENKTVIAIAHRLSTIAAMDRLIVMDQGRIVEEGSHDELIRTGGLYADLWARQSGGFLARQAAE